MKIQVRYRSMLLAALAIFLLAVAAFPQTAFAGTTKGKKDAAPGQVKKDGPADQNQSNANTTPSAGTPTAADNPEGYSKHDQENGPGGQVCDGDPNNEPGAGGNYENTCPAGPSQNGAGDGNANGKPCAGCVGNADDKNPKGQATSGPSDHNNGYECDQKGRSANEGNNGVGYGNPAHTGCQNTPTPTCEDDSSLPGCEPETCPDGSTMPSNGQCKCPDGSTMPSNGQCKCPDGSTMPAGGCKCPDGSTMPSSGKCETPCVPSAANNQCNTCPDGSTMPAGGCKCPDGSTMPSNGQCKCPDGSTMPAGGCKCPDGSNMPANGTCTPPPCVPATGSVCGQETPSCVASAADNRCGGGTTSVLGETLGRPTEVLGVSLTAAPAPVLGAAPSALATTGSQLLGWARFGVLLAFAGLALVLATARRRRATVTAE